MSNITYDMLARQPDTGRMFGLILTGGPGIGKTHAAMAMVKEDEKLVRIAVAGKAKEDMITYPVPDKVDGVWQISQPITESSMIPLLKENIGDGYGLLLLDDTTGGDPSLQTALLELVQFGRVGEHELGKNVAIALTGNGIEDGANAVPWNTALMGRCHTIKYLPNYDLWSELDVNKKVDPVIMSFLEENKDWFAPSIGGENADRYFDDLNRGPQPRIWTTLGTHLYERWGGARNFKPNILFPSLSAYLESMVGENAASAVMTYARTMLEFPTASQMMENPDAWTSLPAQKRNNAGAKYAVAHSVRQHVILENEKINDEFGMTSKKAEKAKKELLVKATLAVDSLMSDDRAVGAFCFRYILSKTDQKDEIGSLLADVAYDNHLDDPILRDAKMDKRILDDIRGMNMGQ